MNIKTFVFNPFYENTYVVSDDNGNALVFDPGCYEPFEREELAAYLSSNQLTLMAIVNTHCHIDHVLGNWSVKKDYKVPLMAPIREKEVFQSIPSYAPSYGFTGYQEATVDDWYDEGQFTFGKLTFKVIEVSGHSPGHMVWYAETEKTIIGGDVLFRDSIGRTDLPGGNHQDLLRNIKEKLYILPDEVKVMPGHGPETTIGHEKVHNPFVRA